MKFTKCVSFYRIRKITRFLLKARSSSKITLVKTICTVIYHGNNNGYHVLLWVNVKVIYSGPKMLETIITKPFFNLGFFSQTFTGQERKAEAISLNLLYHFHPLHRHLDVNQAITAESSPQHMAKVLRAVV